MEKLYPFRGYRYSRQTGDLSNLATQPYDKISPRMLRRYLSLNPCNAAHVIKNPDHEEAGKTFATWIQRGALVQDERPSLYPYEQQFDFEGEKITRIGFVGLIPIDHPDMAVKGHERVLEGPLQDRLNLIRATESNDGLIFSLFSDSSFGIDQILGHFKEAHAPVAEVTDEFGTMHRLWRMGEPELHARIKRGFDGLSVYIADGHHRYRTAQLFAEECRSKGWKSGGVESFDKRMMALFNMRSPGLKILPTHRALRNLTGFEADKLLADLEPFFAVTPQETVHSLLAHMRENGGIGLVTSRPLRLYLLRRRSDPQLPMMPRLKGTARQLDVNLLHEGILRPFLGIGGPELASQRFVDYHRDRGEMLERLREGEYQLAFLLNPTRLDQVRQISEEGEKMPQKSTDFFPKLLTGLVFMKMLIDR